MDMGEYMYIKDLLHTRCTVSMDCKQNIPYSGLFLECKFREKPVMSLRINFHGDSMCASADHKICGWKFS